ncbi:glycoside hydrolase family 13 protein [Nonomuraea sp. NN258]|uniref:glycoside hydrolase family 13 protein n=1 Tax=Nonomuraea antri TaxID=2730852 RepID=UPI0015682178|nr:glycoside hydrolase family 13 protein [Nonomuraea antri]NRQ37793.1 glycoside hydrolase family 13 protein [Nonomuraea antri]
MSDERPWWREAVVYQVYPRSFADADGDGQGDLPGLRSRLDHLAGLGVDAIWLSPFYPSPMADGGYDVADHQAIDPRYGTLDDFDALVAEAADRRIRVIVDLVPNHCSAEHPWFRQALAAPPGSPERERFIFRDEPNNWVSKFGGPAWTQVGDGQWYLHLFDAAQPDWNWRHPDVVALFERVLRFWLDRGVAGFRIDVANLLFKQAGLPDVTTAAPDSPWAPAESGLPYENQPELLELYRSWRKILDSYPGDRMTVAEMWFGESAQAGPYLTGDGLSQLFDFRLLPRPWSAAEFRDVVADSHALAARTGGSVPWVLGNHDVPRMVTRYGIDQDLVRRPTADVLLGRVAVDAELGARRARAATLLLLALPGAAYLYQGDELGLPEHLDIPDGERQDPMFERTGRAFIGRDGCRIPLPWSGETAPYGFSPSPVRTWLPQPDGWARLTAAAQHADPDSALNLHRRALAERRRHPALGAGDLTWLEHDDPDVLAFRRDPGFTLVMNFGPRPVPLPAHQAILLASGPLDGGTLPPDTTVWLETRP